MGEPDFTGARWVASAYHADEPPRVEFTAVNGWIGVRDSVRGNNGPVLALTPEAMSALLTGINEVQGTE